jgi:hypothetical protein
MKETLEIHARLEGVPVRIINDIIRSGKAANKTEALRVALLDYEHHHPHSKFKKSEIDEEEEFYHRAAAESNQDIWDNEKDEKMVQWYLERLDENE